MENSELIMKAEAFAREAHRGQRYGDGADYVDAHVVKVVAIAKEFGASEEQVAAAWLHDVAEDCGVSFDLLYAEFGFIVGGMVGACSGFGDNRAARNAGIYQKIALRPEAALVKVADRIANVEASPFGSHHFAKYSEERDEFDRHVVRFAPPAMRRRLEAAYNLKALA